jgi:hypothetical protein
MAKYIDEVIAAATSSPKGQWKHSAVRCFRRPGHRKCPGRVRVRERDDSYIEWECPSCSAAGTIQGWQRSLYNLSEIREEPRQPGFEIILTEQEYDGLKKCLTMEPEWDGIIFGATWTPDGIVLRADAEDFEDFAECLTSHASCERNPRRRHILERILNGIEELLGGWDSN